MPQQKASSPNAGRRMDPTSPKADRIPRPASTDTFFSEREVINMLEELQEQKQRAESQVSLLHNRIENLQARLDITEDERLAGNKRHNSRTQSEAGSLAVETGSVLSAEREASGLPRMGSDTLSAVSDESWKVESEGGEGGDEREAGEEEAANEDVDDFVRLRSYVQHMQEGASLLLWREEGLQLCWFWLDAQCLSLNWDVDESAPGSDGAAGDSLLLERVQDIVPLGAGPDQLTANPTDSSFTILFDSGRLDIVAPTSLDFQVWYFGLAFATRLRLNALHEANASRSEGEERGGSWGLSPLQSVDNTEAKEPTLDESYATSTRAGEVRGAERPGLNMDESHAVLVRLEDQRKTIERLQRENQMLKEVRRSKDEAISRLLQDLQTSESARESEVDAAGEAKTPATSMESDRNYHHRELFRVRRRNQRMLEILELKEAAVKEMWTLLQHCLADTEQ